MLMRRNTGLHAFRQMVDSMPVNVMTCRLNDFVIDYANAATVATLTKIEHVLPVKAAKLVGSSIDVFHRNPAHQRKLLVDHRNLPFKTRITIGGEILDLLITAIMDGQRYVAPMLTWTLVTDTVKLEAEQSRLKQMVDRMPLAIMTCDLDMKINDINESSVETLRPLEQYLPIRADQLLGQSIDIFHKNPTHQRRLLGDPKNLPHKARIKVGQETLELRVSAIHDNNGAYTGPMLSWSIQTSNVEMAHNVNSIASGVTEAADDLRATAERLVDAAGRASSQSSAVAAATEELTTSVNEISRQASQAAAVSHGRGAHGEHSGRRG